MEAARIRRGAVVRGRTLRYGAACYMPQLVSERPIFLRETADGAYLPVTFLIAKTIEECIIILPFALIYFAAVFFSVGLQGNFLISFGLFYLTVIVGLAIAQMVAAYAPDADAANALSDVHHLQFVEFWLRAPDLGHPARVALVHPVQSFVLRLDGSTQRQLLLRERGDGVPQYGCPGPL